MNYKLICENFEAEIIKLFPEIGSSIAAREDSRAFGAMIERRITENWGEVCRKLGFIPVDDPGRRTIFDFACTIDGQLFGFDVKTKDLDSTAYSDGGVCAVGNLLKYMANDKGIFIIVEFGHNHIGDDSDNREIEYIAVAPFHALPPNTYRIENLGTGQVRLNYTVRQVWDEINWERSYKDFFDIFCELAMTHYARVKTDAEKRIKSIQAFMQSGYSLFKFLK
ncbi:MAG TPA: hypothetical protein VE933_11910 [Chitinophagaceae bacterium]|nr:hypothetical protein [Chitinophagaceae bacterium]